MRRSLWAILLFLALAAWSQEPPVYSVGTIVRITSQSLFEASRGRPTTGSAEKGPADSGAYGSLRILFIQQTSTVYVAEVLNPKAAYPAKLRKGAVVHFRIAGDDLYLKDPAGPEIWTRLLEKNPKGPLRKSE